MLTVSNPASYEEALAAYRAALDEVNEALEDFQRLRDERGVPDYVPAVAHGEGDPVFVAWRRIKDAQDEVARTGDVFHQTPEPPSDW